MWHIFTNHIANNSYHRFATHVWPYNWAIGITPMLPCFTTLIFHIAKQLAFISVSTNNAARTRGTASTLLPPIHTNTTNDTMG